jgi:N-acetylglucosaminyldiphosphoundecaprenol N-acetyl-beta-D-mannosaminyltransferase
MTDDLSRNVHCVLGIPVDVVDVTSILRNIEAAAVFNTPLFISTPNVNFLVASHSDQEFKKSLIQSDLCPADGLPVVWMARLVGIPLKSRVAGSDIFEQLRAARRTAKPLKIFLFGGQEGVAALASQRINVLSNGLRCVGVFYPGFGSVDEMSRDEIVDLINRSGANILLVSLGAKKGQAWLLRNNHRLLIPIRAHLGAVLNFEAAVIKRAPPIIRRFGLEWLWRIKEEPHLWRRYLYDGGMLLHLVLTRVLPLAILMWWWRMKYQRSDKELVIAQTHNNHSITLIFYGPAIGRHIEKIVLVFRAAIATRKEIAIDFSHTCAVDARFLGALLMLWKNVSANGVGLICFDLSPKLKRIFYYNGLNFMLSLGKGK